MVLGLDYETSSPLVRAGFALAKTEGFYLRYYCRYATFCRDVPFRPAPLSGSGPPSPRGSIFNSCPDQWQGFRSFPPDIYRDKGRWSARLVRAGFALAKTEGFLPNILLYCYINTLLHYQIFKLTNSQINLQYFW